MRAGTHVHTQAPHIHMGTATFVHVCVHRWMCTHMHVYAQIQGSHAANLRGLRAAGLPGRVRRSAAHKLCPGQKP